MLARAVVDRHLPALPDVVRVAIALVGKVLQGEASPHQYARLTVLGEDHVIWVQGRGAAHVKRLFARVGHVERYSALPLGTEEDVVHGLYANDDFVHALRRLPAEFRHGGPRQHSPFQIYGAKHWPYGLCLRIVQFQPRGDWQPAFPCCLRLYVPRVRCFRLTGHHFHLVQVPIYCHGRGAVRIVVGVQRCVCISSRSSSLHYSVRSGGRRAAEDGPRVRPNALLP
mmetsp:Transcript_17494/g.66622  ORF Transcript_17494/g.66622 Transcript_17494/m.66622 type:complete len:226 (-) Transcript_17494:129-806(-)